MSKILSPKTLIAAVIIYALSAGITYAVVPTPNGEMVSPGAAGQQQLGGAPAASTGFAQFANEPKTSVCPINGKLYSKSEEALWQTRRPILAMIENHVDARPQSGISLADVVYEAVAEGGITRFMGVFYCGAQQDVARVAPVRSARIYFVNIAAEYNTPVYMHVGGANCGRDEATGQCVSNPKAFAIEELAKLGWRKPGGNDFDTTSDTGYPVLVRDYNRLGPDKTAITEHTMTGSLPAAWKQAEKRGYTAKMPDDSTWVKGFTPWKIAAATTTTGAPASDVKFDFWPGYKDFSVEWKYDAASQTYLRSDGGTPQIDFDTKLQLSASNVIVQLVKETNLNDYGKHMFYDVISSGTGYLFQNGSAVAINWKKASQKARTIYTDKSGQEIKLIPGTIWVELVPTTSPVTYL